MSHHAGELIVQLMQRKNDRSYRDQEVRDELVRLQKQCIHQQIAVVRPHLRRGGSVVPQVHATEQPPTVEQPVQPVEPRNEQQRRKDE
jgi:hypothetical protein